MPMRRIAARTWPGALLRAMFFFLAWLPSVTLRAQTQHTLSAGREAVIAGVGLGFVGIGLGQADRNHHRAPRAIDITNVPLLDRVATRQWSLPAHRTSNWLFGISAAAALAVSIGNQHGEQPMLPVVIMAESSLLCAGLTNTTKALVRRPRPYLYNPEAPLSAQNSREDRLSFWSGHTANCAAITFSCASMVQRSDASPGFKTGTWIGAAAAPALMGYLRVRAGRHFPTDVLTGCILGALVGIAVPYFHRTEGGAPGN